MKAAKESETRRRRVSVQCVVWWQSCIYIQNAASSDQASRATPVEERIVVLEADDSDAALERVSAVRRRGSRVVLHNDRSP